ncbi:MAG: BMP family ABC transporter substrate-binding protein [Lachnospiraceae bacterium]|nr:BMP family ABC transporter substrate-binding protein [Lachnospiraceae bacterium]MBP3610696.1 BMP family ABC transporter substrate-binding protein [Lachnospiraceae bacterium]
MKKRIALLLMICLFGVMSAGCAGREAYEIALVTDKGNVDDRSFNQGAWEGVVEFAGEQGISHKFYRPEASTDDAYFAAIELAIQGGAKVIVTPGYLFEVAVYYAQLAYPEVTFILLDGTPHTADYAIYETKENVAGVLYAEEEAGYLAGYAAVMDGMRCLGFVGGMAVPSVQAFGYGYLQGIEAAARELLLPADSVRVIYHYTGNFEENDTNKQSARAMYASGAEVIFACGGAAGKSVISAAVEEHKKVIGVDVDQRYDSSTVITSAMKGLSASVKEVLESVYDGTFSEYAGKATYFTAANHGIGLPTTVAAGDNGTAFDRFVHFTQEEYEAVFSRLADGTVDPVRTVSVADAGGIATAEELKAQLGLECVTVEVR